MCISNIFVVRRHNKYNGEHKTIGETRQDRIKSFISLIFPAYKIIVLLLYLESSPNSPRQRACNIRRIRRKAERKLKRELRNKLGGPKWVEWLLGESNY